MFHHLNESNSLDALNLSQIDLIELTRQTLSQYHVIKKTPLSNNNDVPTM